MAFKVFTNKGELLLNTIGGGGGSGSVTSFSSGDLSPLFTTSVATSTTTPALSFTLNTQAANLVFAGPSSGPDDVPTFRALTSADLPGGIGTVTSVAWTTSQGVSASIANPTGAANITITLGALTGVTSYNGLVITADTGAITTGIWNGTKVSEAYGGTNQSTYTTGDILYASASNTLSKLPISTDGKVLTLLAGAPSWQTPSAGTVSSVSGTTNRITVATGTTTPVVDISASYVGQTSITTLGTIVTGVWNGTAIANANLANSTITVNGTSTALGSSVTITTTGTSNRISVSGGGGLTPTVDISATYVGQSSITTLGTIVTGTWNATPITVPYGGTGNTTFTAFSVICAGTTATGTFQNVSGLGTSGYVLTSAGAGALPVWAAPATNGTVTTVSVVTNQGVSGSVANPTTTPAITLTLGALTGVTSFNGLVVTANTGAITTGTWNGTLVTGQYGGTGVANTGFTITIAGNLITTGAFNTTFAAVATATYTLPVSTATLASLALAEIFTNKTITSSTNTIGGVTMGLGSDAVGDIYTAGTSNILTRIAAVAAGSYLRSAGTATKPIWSTLILPNAATVNYIPYATSANTWGENSIFQFNGVGLTIGTTPAVSEALLIQTSQNSTLNFNIVNVNAGSSANANMVAGSNAGNLFLRVTSTTYSLGSGVIGIGCANIYTTTTGGMNIGTSVNANLRFYVNNANKLTLLPSGALLVGNLLAATIGTETLSVQVTQNAATYIEVYNSNAGTASSSGFDLRNDASRILQALMLSTAYTTSGALIADSGGLYCNGTGGLVLISAQASAPMLFYSGGQAAANLRLTIDSKGSFTLAPGAIATGSITPFLFTSGANTNQTLSTEAIGVNYNLSATIQFATGALTTQRAFVIQAPTYGFVGASTITNAATLAISGAPITGTNATLTNSAALWVQAGDTRLDGDLKITTAGKTIYLKEGGAAATSGQAQLVGGTLLINTTSALTASRIYVTDAGGGVLANIGALYIAAIVNGVSFTVTSTNPIDTSLFNWFIIQPA